MSDNFAKIYAEDLAKNDPEFANDLYFALDEIFVKKTPWHKELTQVVHQWVNPSKKIYVDCVIKDANDGSGDGILTFPEGLCDDLGWKEGDTLNLELFDGEKLRITKLS